MSDEDLGRGMMLGVAHEFDPDWTIAPAATLRAWMREHHLSAGALARRAGCGEADFKAALIIRDVLGRKPLLEAHAEVLERGTDVPARLWLSLEQGYRADLAAGRADCTPDE